MKTTAPNMERYAAMLAAMGTGPRLRIIRLLLAAHPQGLVPGEMQEELAMPGSTLSHHLEKLKIAGLVEARRERQFLWYTARADTLRELLGFLFAECCTRTRAVPVESILPAGRGKDRQ